MHSFIPCQAMFVIFKLKMVDVKVNGFVVLNSGYTKVAYICYKGIKSNVIHMGLISEEGHSIQGLDSRDKQYLLD